MRRLIAPDRRGMSLMETLIVILVVGILAALGVPNVFATLNSGRAREGLGVVRNALQDAQLQAIRRGQQCTVELGKAQGSTSPYFDRLRATPIGCFVASETFVESATPTYQTILLPREIKLSTNLSAARATPPTAPTFQFSFKGHLIGYGSLAPTGQIPTLVVFGVNESNDSPFTDSRFPRKCLMVASMLGMLRGGNYLNVTTASQLASANITSNNCNAFLEGRG